MRTWRRLWQWAGGWLSQGTDLELLTRYVETLVWRDELRDGLVGKTTERGSMGQLVTHPDVKVLLQVERILLTQESRLGFTPSDRTRIGGNQVAAAKHLDQLQAEQEKRRAERDKIRAMAKPNVDSGPASS